MDITLEERQKNKFLPWRKGRRTSFYLGRRAEEQVLGDSLSFSFAFSEVQEQCRRKR